MNLLIKDKIAIVTGASAGLGKSIALGLAKEGAKIAISGRRKEVLDETAKEILNKGQTEVLTFTGDMTQKENVNAFISQIIETWNTIHILVNNVGQAKQGYLDTLLQHDWKQTFEINLISAICTSTQVLPFMRAQKWGRIINISALSGTEPSSGLIASNVAKSGLINFSKTLSRDLAPDNILVNCVSPGLIDSPQNDGYFSPQEKENAQNRIPLKRFGDPKEFADAVVFLCSERASYITGINLIVDGGAAHSI